MIFEYQGKELDYDYFYIDWKIGEQCNYNCSYCVQQYNTKSNSFPTKIQIKNAIDIIKRINRKNIDFSIAGGETTLYPDLKFLINEIDNNIENLNKLTILTNGTKSIKYYTDLFNKKDKHYLYFSVHPEFFKIEQLEKKIKDLSEVSNLQVALMYKKTHNIQKYIDIIDSIYNNKEYEFYPKLVILREGEYFNKISSEYTESDYNIIKYYNQKWYDENLENRKTIWLPQKYKNLEHNSAIIDSYLNFKNMYCIHGATNLWIDNFGFCKGAICHQAKQSSFSIYDKVNPYLLKNYLVIVKCKSDCCGCKDNLLIPKFLKKEKAISCMKSLIF